MKAFFKLLFPFLASSIFIGCDSDVIGVQKAPSFEDREVVQALTDEPGRIEYYCDGDTTFIYLSTDAESFSDMYLMNVDSSQRIFNEFFLWMPEVYSYNNVCWVDLDFIDTNIPVLITGELLAGHELDNFPVYMKPLKLTKLESQKCQKDSVNLSLEISEIVGNWEFYRVVNNDIEWVTPCEEKDVSLTFTTDSIELGYPPENYFALWSPAFRGCELGFKIDNSNRIQIKVGICILGLGNTTMAAKEFNGILGKILLAHGGLSYQLIDNWLILTDNQGNRIELFRTE